MSAALQVVLFPVRVLLGQSNGLRIAANVSLQLPLTSCEYQNDLFYQCNLPNSEKSIAGIGSEFKEDQAQLMMDILALGCFMNHNAVNATLMLHAKRCERIVTLNDSTRICIDKVPGFLRSDMDDIARTIELYIPKGTKKAKLTNLLMARLIEMHNEGTQSTNALMQYPLIYPVLYGYHVAGTQFRCSAFVAVPLPVTIFFSEMGSGSGSGELRRLMTREHMRNLIQLEREFSDSKEDILRQRDENSTSCSNLLSA